MANLNDTSESPIKRCSKCNFTCDYSEAGLYFSRNKNRKDGLQNQCKQCNASYVAEHREKITAYNANHREEIAARRATYRVNHREKLRASSAAYYAEHSEERRAYAATYHAEHREEINAHAAAYGSLHCEEKRAWRTSPRGKELARIRSHNRRALKKAQGDKITQAEYEAVLKAHTNLKGQIICAWCGKPIKGGWHYDHWIPLDKGGRHESGNLRVMHGKTGGKCNQRKHAKLPFEFGKLI